MSGANRRLASIAQFNNLTPPGLGVAEPKVYKYTPTKEDLHSQDITEEITLVQFKPRGGQLGARNARR